MADEIARKHLPPWTIIVTAAIVGAIVIAGGGYLAWTSIFGSSIGCLDGVAEVSAEIRVAEAGTVQSSKTLDTGGISACASPTMTVVLTGPGVQANVERGLRGAEFTERSPGWWSRDGDYVTVESRRPGITTVVIVASPN